MKKLMFAATVALSLVASVANATQYSRLALKTAAQKYGKWDALVTWLKAAGFYDDFLIANNLSDEYPQFPAVTNAIVQAGIATTAEVEQILSESVDTAVPDTALMAKYNRDMQTASGREAWHGKPTSYLDEEAFQRVYVYEDGYIYRENWKKPETELERRLRLAREKAEALVAAAERNAKKKPPAVADIIIKRAKSEAFTLTNGVEQVTVDVKSGKVVTPTGDGK